MGNLIWFIWFFISRKVAYLSIFGIWLFSGLRCLVGGSGSASPPDIWALYWAIGTLALIPALIWYTRYNVAVFIQRASRGSLQAAEFIQAEWRKGRSV